MVYERTVKMFNHSRLNIGERHNYQNHDRRNGNINGINNSRNIKKKPDQLQIDFNRSKMRVDKRIAITAGVLFLIALLFNIIASGIFDPIISVSGYLKNVNPHKNEIIIGNLLNVICAISMIFIPIVMFPLGTKINNDLAIGYNVFRFLEGVLQIYIAIKVLNLISLSNLYINTGADNFPLFQSIGDTIQSEIQWAEIIYIIMYICGALAFYSLLYKSKFVPRFLSLWGIFAVLLLLAGEVLGIFGLGIFSTMPLMKGMIYFAPPVALNEFVLSIWLIAKGFNTAVIDQEQRQ